ncbi:MAG: hypothetical protein ABW004_02265 [Aeromicrobium sp.]
MRLFPVETTRPARSDLTGSATRGFVLGLPPADRLALVDLLRDELARGWIPTRADLEAALLVVRARGA